MPVTQPSPVESEVQATPTPEPAETQTTETPPEVTTERTTAEEQASFRDLLQKRGYNADKYVDDDAAAEAFVQAQQALSRRDELAALGRLVNEDRDAYLQFLQEKQKKVATPARSAEPAWDFTQYRLAQTQYTDPATGELRVNTPPDVASRIKQYQDKMPASLWDIANSPEKVVGPIIKQAIEEARQQWLQEMQQLQTQQTESQQINEFVSQQAEWLYANKQNESSGYTPQGQRYIEYVAAAVDAGFPRLGALEYAMLKINAEQPNGQQPAKPTAKTPAKKGPAIAPRNEEMDVEKMIMEGKVKNMSELARMFE
jgi:hypothetical protein